MYTALAEPAASAEHASCASARTGTTPPEREQPRDGVLGDDRGSDSGPSTRGQRPALTLSTTAPSTPWLTGDGHVPGKPDPC